MLGQPNALAKSRSSGSPNVISVFVLLAWNFCAIFSARSRDANREGTAARTRQASPMRR